MPKAKVLHSNGGMNCPHCDEWIRQPDDPSVTSVDCPSCGANVEVVVATQPARPPRKSSGAVPALLVVASIAVILGIYGYSIYDAKYAGQDQVAAFVPPTAPESATEEIVLEEFPASDAESPPPALPELVEQTGDAELTPPAIPELIDDLEETITADVVAPTDAVVFEDSMPDEVASPVAEVAPLTGPVPFEEPVEDTVIVEAPDEDDPPRAVAVVDDAEPAIEPAEPVDEPVEPAIESIAAIEEEAPFDEEAYLQAGWKIEAAEVLHGFMASGNMEERRAFVLNPELVAASMRAIERQGSLPWQGLTVENFKHIDLSEADRRKGIFLMLRETPGEDAATDANRSYAFFKRTDQGLKLDFEVFVQSTGRTFQQFIAAPQPGFSQVFRVFITLDPTGANSTADNYRTYFLAGLSDLGSATRIRVTNGSPVGQILSDANFTSEDGSRRVMRNATVELRWTDQPDHSALEISRFICWEFLGLGGDTSEE